MPPTSPGARAKVAATTEEVVASILEEVMETTDKAVDTVKAAVVAVVHRLKVVAMVDKARLAVRTRLEERILCARSVTRSATMRCGATTVTTTPTMMMKPPPSTPATTSTSSPPAIWTTEQPITSLRDLDRLAVREVYNGNERVHVKNGAGLHIYHVDHGTLDSTAKTLALRNILHVPNITKNLLSAHKLARDNSIFVEIHTYHFIVKDRASRRRVL
jgi:hypothetical protein